MRVGVDVVAELGVHISLIHTKQPGKWIRSCLRGRWKPFPSLGGLEVDVDGVCVG